MTLVHVTENVKGGIATYLDTVAEAQCARYGAEAVMFLVTPDGRTNLRAVPAANKVPVAPARGSLRAFLRYARDVGRELRHRQPTVVHAHSTHAGVVVRALRLCWVHRARVVYCAHGWSFDREDGAVRRCLYQIMERLLAPQAAKILCISKHDYRRGREIGIPRARLALVYNGIAESGAAPSGTAFDAVPDDKAPLRLLFLGRIDRQKGFDVLCAALDACTRPWRLVCIGARVLDDSDDAALAPHPSIDYKGWLPGEAIAAELARADAVVVPSRWEGFGLVAVEAMRQGRAVVASRAGGLPEIVVEGETGRLVPPGDAEALSRTLADLNPADLGAWGAAGYRRYSDFFTSARLNARLDDIYEAVGLARNE